MKLKPFFIPLTVGLGIFVAGCTAPIGADRVTTRQAYAQVDANALRSGKPSPKTMEVLHRFDLDRLAEKQPDEVVRRLHEKALATGERDLLFALAEMSFVAGEQISHSVKPWDTRDPRDYYLGSAVYAWLFLYGEGKDAPPGPYERRFREACDFYNYSLGLALLDEPRGAGATIQLANGRRRLPVGEIELHLEDTPVAERLDSYEQILLADQFRVRGLSVRNRDAGVGAPLICVGAMNPDLKVQRAAPATVFLRGPASLKEITAGTSAGSLELYSVLEASTVTIGGAQVPLESDLTTYRAYTLNQSSIWKLGPLQFLAPGEHIKSQLILNQPYTPGLVPVVFVHGTFSSPVTWAEMANTLSADPRINSRYQLWSFVYSSGNPLPVSAAELRDALTATVQKLDPEGKDPALRQMVIIGHSQGSLLTKFTAVETGDKIWSVFSTNRLEDLKITEAERKQLHHLLFVEPLPFVKRVVFICGPFRGSYLSSSFVRKWGRRLMSLPRKMVSHEKELNQLTQGSAAGKFLSGKMPTSLDGMSPDNPGLLALAEIPVVPPIKAHSIIAVEGDDQPPKGADGIVKYASAHQDYTESELIVRSFHTCLDNPNTIEEVRRILYEHLDQLPADLKPPAAAAVPQK
jgi:pimeloyl-ACP methyl ester carboxylesterase